MIPPVPTFPAVKLRPPLVSCGCSDLAFLLLFLIDLCLKTSVLFFTRLKEFDLFLFTGSELFLTWNRVTRASQVLLFFFGLEPCCEAEGTVVPVVVAVT